MKHSISWFEIPAQQIERATTFYGQILDSNLHTTTIMGMKMAFLPAEENAVSGALVEGEDYTPATNGALVYLNGGNDLNKIANRIDRAGGKLIIPKTKISDEFGYFAIFIDSEGNRIALHSMN
jgi:hypothetical protein